jgi:hypothetical protein
VDNKNIYFKRTFIGKPIEYDEKRSVEELARLVRLAFEIKIIEFTLF